MIPLPVQPMNPMMTGISFLRSGSIFFFIRASLSVRAVASPCWGVVRIPASQPSNTVDGMPRWRRAAPTIGASSRSPYEMT